MPEDLPKQIPILSPSPWLPSPSPIDWSLGLLTVNWLTGP